MTLCQAAREARRGVELALDALILIEEGGA
jgi:hypothetical protein